MVGKVECTMVLTQIGPTYTWEALVIYNRSLKQDIRTMSRINLHAFSLVIHTKTRNNSSAFLRMHWCTDICLLHKSWCWLKGVCWESFIVRRTEIWANEHPMVTTIRKIKETIKDQRWVLLTRANLQQQVSWCPEWEDPLQWGWEAW